MAERWFFAADALAERLQGAARFAPYEKTPIFTSQVTLYELVARLIRDHAEGRVREALALLSPNLVEAQTDDLFVAARLRAQHPERKLGAEEALSYAIARREGMRFVTADKSFSGLEGVELLK